MTYLAELLREGKVVEHDWFSATTAAAARKKALAEFIERGHDGVHAQRATSRAIKVTREDRV